MTNKQLIDKLSTFPSDAKILIRWEDFAISDIQDFEYCEEDNELLISHDCIA